MSLNTSGEDSQGAVVIHEALKGKNIEEICPDVANKKCLWDHYMADKNQELTLGVVCDVCKKCDYVLSEKCLINH